MERSEYCSDRCFESAQAGKPAYAPCPLVREGTPEEELCNHCGYYIPLPAELQQAIVKESLKR